MIVRKQQDRNFVPENTNAKEAVLQVEGQPSPATDTVADFDDPPKQLKSKAPRRSRRKGWSIGVKATALSTTQQVTRGAKDLEQLAVITASQTQQQAQSVNEVQALMKDVNALSQNIAGQSVAADQAVQRAQAAVTHGLLEMTAMTTGIKTLHQGTKQIVERTQALTDFVDLAAQFAKAQKRVGAMTRVLALNASLLSARASGQQDPDQFASVAREFETVATQVNDLSVQTNQSLVLLQQRTDQIQTVVSGLNQDVQGINQLVNDFTTGVGQSRLVFDNIKTATEQVAQVEQQVTQSSYAIAQVTQTTLKSIQDIASLAVETEQQASFTREQSGAIGQLASNLLEIVQFFQVSPQKKASGTGGEVT